MIMGVSTESTDVYSCDADDCDVARPALRGDRPTGYYATVEVVYATGGTATAPFYACRLSHVGKAVKAVTDAIAAKDNGDEDGEVYDDDPEAVKAVTDAIAAKDNGGESGEFTESLDEKFARA